ncbi:hypothetical protein CW713_02765 [Methanophagales archaeon]|nr:MAG: hypothetical protein CW713_02765 [Methanophagales archaeon]
MKLTEIRSILESMTFPEEIPIDSITGTLKSHFFHKYSSAGASKLPVIAMYSLYQLMMKGSTRYRNKTLKSLGGCHQSDKESSLIS